jgi:hypothetical protein
MKLPEIKISISLWWLVKIVKKYIERKKEENAEITDSKDV